MSLEHRVSALRLELEDLSKSFGGVHAVEEVRACIDGPGITGLIGPNGSGKSTLLGILSGLVHPDEGRVVLDGRPLPLGSSHRVALRGVGRGFQAARLIGNLRVWENVAFGMHRRMKRREIRARSYELLRLLDLEHALYVWPADLTAAERRRLQVASAIASEPRVLLLDEPASGLTDSEAHLLAEAIRRLAPESLVIVVEHNMQVIFSIASRVLVLLDGRLVADGSPSQISRNPVVQAAYLGGAATHEHKAEAR